MLERIVDAQVAIIIKHTEEQPTQFIFDEIQPIVVKQQPFQFSLPYAISEVSVRNLLEVFVKEGVFQAKPDMSQARREEIILIVLKRRVEKMKAN